MKKKETSSYKEKSVLELKKSVAEKKERLIKLYAEIHAGKEKNTSSYRNLRKEVARLLTIIRQKQIIEEEEN